MITEHALLPVKPGLEAEFESAFREARPIIASMPGFISLALHRGIESPSTYLLLVEWQSVEHHEVGFRQSPGTSSGRRCCTGFTSLFPS